MRRGYEYLIVVCVVLLVLAGAALIGLSAGQAVQASASASAAHDWYFLPDKNGGRPAPCDTAPFIGKYDAYYIGADKKIIYLTFDAGYENGYTERILDVLKENDVPAAFFVTGHYVSSAPEMIKRMAAEGHLVCNHGDKHKDLATASSDEIAAELAGVAEKYKKLTGEEMRPYMRPPEGSFSERMLMATDKLGYSCFFWSFAYKDWVNDEQPKAQDAVERILSRTHNGMIALLHSTSRTNSEILAEVIEQWKLKGYSFGTLDELAAGSGKGSSGQSIIPGST